MTDADRRIASIGEIFGSLTGELAITVSDGRVWLAFAVALALGALCTVLGAWIARLVGLLDEHAPHGEVVGIGLGVGLLAFAAAWAAVGSGGRSGYTPVALSFALALGLHVLRRREGGHPAAMNASQLRRRSTITTVLACVGFIVGVGLLFGATLAPSPRDGVQPVEFFDAAYYSALGADLAKTGTETIYSPSGFDDLAGLPPQTWYHWGELWLSAALIGTVGVEPILARHVVVLPLLLLAVATLTGALVRRANDTRERSAFLFGAAAGLFLAPLPLYAGGPHFTNWASGLIFGINQYGLVTIPVLLGLVAIVRPGSLGRTWGGVLFVAGVVASIIPSHPLLAGLAALGGASALAVSLAARAVGLIDRHPDWTRPSLRAIGAIGTVAAATTAWGFLTGHGFGASALAPSVTPFNEAWRETVIRTALGGGLLLVGPIGWCALSGPRSSRIMAAIAAAVAIGTGVVVWGALLGDFNMFHAFFGAVVVLGTPLGAASTWALWRAARNGRRRGLAAALFVLSGVQLGIGGVVGLARLELFSPPAHPPIPLSVLNAIEQLPPNAKLAYSCSPLEEFAFWDPSLVSIDAHTGRRIVPMCFQAEIFTALLTGGQNSPDVVNPMFAAAPQRDLYPTSAARPSPEALAEFMARHGIGYIYEDPEHPNRLFPDASPVATDRGVRLLRIP